MSKARYPTRMQQFRVKKAFREGHQRIFGPGKFPETDQPKRDPNPRKVKPNDERKP